MDCANILLDKTAFRDDLAGVVSHDRLAEAKGCADDVFPDMFYLCFAGSGASRS